MSEDRKALALKMLAVAQGYVQAGVHEVGGNNRGDQVEAYLSLFHLDAGNPWCAAFVSACACKAWAFQNHLSAGRGCWPLYLLSVAAHLFTPSPSCGVIERAARANGLWRDPTTPWQQVRPGWLALFNFDGGAASQHIGIVEEATEGVLKDIEGNTALHNNTDGDGVTRRLRSYEFVAGYVATY